MSARCCYFRNAEKSTRTGKEIDWSNKRRPDNINIKSKEHTADVIGDKQWHVHHPRERKKTFLLLQNKDITLLPSILQTAFQISYLDFRRD